MKVLAIFVSALAGVAVGSAGRTHAVRPIEGGTAQQTAQSAPSASQSASSKPAKEAQETIAVPLPKGKKLILNDGSYQLVREYSVQGDRVRYWSVERSQWEEIPAAMVNWDATKKAEAEQAQKDAELQAKIHATELAERTKDIDVDRSLEIKPGLFLPDDVGFYALDGRTILNMKQSEAVSKSDKLRALERGISGVPLIPSRLRIEIPGKRAALRVTTAEPEFYMRPADSREPRIVLLRAKVTGNHRLVESISTNIAGEESSKGQEIELMTWTPATGVFRYTVGEHLNPGEYAFVEITEEGVSLFVWDFGVDPPPDSGKH